MHTKNYFGGVALIFAAVSMLLLGACNGKKSNAEAQGGATKTDLSQLKIGDYYYSDGTFSTKQDSSKTCVGIVFSLKTTPAQKKQGWSHGQIVALANAGAGEECEWGALGKELGDPFGKYSWKNWKAASGVVNGYECSHASSVASYKAFKAAAKFMIELPAGKTSGWYIPAVGQWAEIIVNLGKVQFKKDGSFDANMALGNLSMVGLKNHFYWTSTQVDKNLAWYVDFATGVCSGDSKDTRNKVRCVAAI